MKLQTSLKNAFTRPFSEPKLLGILFAEALTVFIVAVFFYVLSLQLLSTMFALPLENTMELLAQDLLPPAAGNLILVMTVLAGISLLFVTVFFEAGLFSRIAHQKETFFAAMKRLFIPFLLIVLFFQALELLSLVFYVPGMLLPELVLIGNLLLLLSQLFLFVWDTTARFLAVKHKPLVSLKKSLKHIWQYRGDWGLLLLVTILILFTSLIVVGLLAWISSPIPLILFLILLCGLAYFLYLSLVIRILFYNRIKDKI